VVDNNLTSDISALS